MMASKCTNALCSLNGAEYVKLGVVMDDTLAVVRYDGEKNPDIKIGDVITHVDALPVKTKREYILASQRFLKTCEPGSELTVNIQRNGKSASVTLTPLNTSTLAPGHSSSLCCVEESKEGVDWWGTIKSVAQVAGPVIVAVVGLMVEQNDISKRKTGACFRCGQYGHWVASCPKR